MRREYCRTAVARNAGTRGKKLLERPSPSESLTYRSEGTVTYLGYLSR
jgi:hypothetical protein